jgi:Cu/Ag efflux pump CusA
VVLGGLFTSTALTLLVLPALYTLFGKFIIKPRSEQIHDSKIVI